MSAADLFRSMRIAEATPLAYGDALKIADAALVDAGGPLKPSPGQLVLLRDRLARDFMVVDVEGRAQAWEDRGGPELVEALIAVTPGHRKAGECWCPISRDITGHGHEAFCLKAQAALEGHR